MQIARAHVLYPPWTGREDKCTTTVDNRLYDPSAAQHAATRAATLCVRRSMLNAHKVKTVSNTARGLLPYSTGARKKLLVCDCYLEKRKSRHLLPKTSTFTISLYRATWHDAQGEGNDKSPPPARKV